MGTYDVFSFYCHACGERIEIQSKADLCNMWHYSASNAPLTILTDVAGGGPYICGACGARWNVDVKASVSVHRASNESEHNDHEGGN